MEYTLKSPRYYYCEYEKLYKCNPGSYRLWLSCWKQYRNWLKGSIDDPRNDNDVLGWLDTIASEKVNNPQSSFYIHG